VPEERTSGLTQRIATLPLWIRLALLAVLVGVAVLLSKWLVLIVLIALGLWPITVLIGLAALALFSVPRGGWSWMRPWLGARLRDLAIPLLSIITALFIGALVIMFTDPEVYAALGRGQIVYALRSAFGNVARAYGALYEGAFGNPLDILQAIGRALSGEGLDPILRAVRGPSDSMVQSVPYIFAGLAVALGFRAGLFNIGAEGQIGVGWIAAVIVGFSFTGLPMIIRLETGMGGARGPCFTGPCSSTTTGCASSSRYLRSSSRPPLGTHGRSSIRNPTTTI